MKLRKLNLVLVSAAVTIFIVSLAQAITIDLVPVGNPGNAGELSGAGAGGVGPDAVVGGVDYVYQIGTYEVTAGQYVDFLNNVAATDPYGLYNENMCSEYGCMIERSGSPGSYAYSVTADRANRPVNYVSWYDAARFTNWLTTGDTETGVYAFTDGSLTNILPHESADATLGCKAWFLPTEDEWYKAAYHKNDGVTGNYYDFATGSDTPPSNALTDPDPGNNANFYFYSAGFTVGSPYYTTEVGEFENSESPYGTFDQAGNLWEWNETATDTKRGLRGGYWRSNYSYLRAAYRTSYDPTSEDYFRGFRVASIPEPGSLVLLAGIALATLLCRGRNRA